MIKLRLKLSKDMEQRVLDTRDILIWQLKCSWVQEDLSNSLDCHSIQCKRLMQKYLDKF
jgi:hypothetical protein